MYDDGVQFLDLIKSTKFKCTKLTFVLKRVKGGAIVVLGVRGNRNPRVLDTFAAKVSRRRQKTKRIVFLVENHPLKVEFFTL